VSIFPWRTHLRSVSADPIASFAPDRLDRGELRLVVRTDFSDYPHGPLPQLLGIGGTCVTWLDILSVELHEGPG
jgi:hypothetical protein